MNLHELRKSKGLTASFVAGQLKISTKHLNRIEHDEGYLTRERVKILAKLYGVKMSEIMEGREEYARVVGRSRKSIRRNQEKR